MDYVVFGIGFGATILVLGLLLRDLGPRVRYRRGSNGVLPADVLVAKVAWDRFCNALGAVLAIGGILFLLATFVCIFLTLSNDTGGWVMLASLAVFLLLTLYWTWAFFDRFGAYGILPERPVAEEQSEPAPAPSPARGAAPTGGDAAPEHAESAVIGPTLEETVVTNEAEGEPVEPQADGTPAAGVAGEGDEAEGEPGAEAEPESVGEEPMITPEERLALMEEPIDHGSAAGDLDAEPGVARPAAFAGRRGERPREDDPADGSGEGEDPTDTPGAGDEGRDGPEEEREPAPETDAGEASGRDEEDGSEPR